MPLNLSEPTSAELKPKIVVIGVGGAGGNAVNNMIESELDGVTFVCANTDAQAVGLSKAEQKIQLGTGVTQGLGAGSRPQIGEAAAEESLDEVMTALDGANMLFITAGMGGGTGTGAAPVIAKAARDLGILTVGVVTKPFAFEGQRRMRIADEGIEELSRHVDTLLIIPNQNLFRLADENTTFADAFGMADRVLYSGVRGITDLMIVPGHINLDFADVRTVMSEMGKAMMGTGECQGESRASEAAAAAISNPLLDEMSLKGAKGVLINITGGLDMKLFEVDEAANAIRSEVDPEANIIVGSTFDQSLEGTIRVSVVATGIDGAEERVAPRPPVIRAAVQSAAQPEATPAPQAPTVPPVAEPQEPLVAALTPAADANPVGDVHERIRRMLTEDPVPAREELRKQGRGRANPFRGKPVSTLETAMGLLRDTLKPGKSEERPRRMPSAKPLTDDDDEVEVPAFLRRQN
ncbi:MAG: cell division protein FtsZ [Pseudomonadota bacterium]